MNVRIHASLALQKIILQQQSLTVIVDDLPTQHKAYCQTLIYGVCRWFWQCDSITQQVLNKPFKDKDQDVYFLLLIAIFEIFHLATADYAIVDESVKCCNIIKKSWAKTVLNAVLRQCLLKKEALLKKCQQKEVSHYSHPNWLVKAIKKDWPKQYDAILTANNHQAAMHLRVNVLKTRQDDYLALLGNNANAHPVLGITLTKACDITDLEKFAEGYCSVQDPSAQQAALLLQPQQHDRILDACAAPGGKTGHLHELAPQADITAIELKSARATKISENAQRLGFQPKLIIADAAELTSWWNGQAFTKILCDAPCSASGVIRRHPDIKHLRKKKDIQQLAKQQLKLLQQLWQTLAPGGALLYCTCSIFNAENDAVIEEFLTTHQAKKTLLNLPVGQATQYGWQILPGEQGMDGFYYCLLEKLHE